MSKILFLFTNTYPYSTGETYIENEMPYLAETFDRVIIVSNDISGKQTRTVPQNVKMERMPYTLNLFQKTLSLSSLLSPAVWREFLLIRTRYRQRITCVIFNTVLQSYRKTRVFKTLIDAIISEHSDTKDEIYLYSYWSNDVALAIAEMPQRSNIRRKIARAHGSDVYFEANSAQYLPFRELIIKKMDFQLFISDKGKSYYQVLYPEITPKMAVSRLGVTCQNVKIEHISRDRFVIVSCSHVFPLKRLNLIAKGISEVNDIDVEWHHFGDGPLFEELKSNCQELFAHRNNIAYHLHGRVLNTDFVAFITANPVHAFINASTSEGIPVSIMEAMSVAIPCIATAVGGTPEIVNSKNGILLDPNPTPGEIAEAIEYLQSMPEDDYLQKRKSAYKTWDTQYNADKNYRQFINETLLGNTAI